MRITFGKNKLKAAAVILCAVITAASLTYVKPDDNLIRTEARTISEIEEEKADIENRINDIQNSIDSLKSDISQREEYQRQLQDKLDLQNENIDKANIIINDLNNKISDKEKKITQLQDDISSKEEDIDTGLELFKERLRAMYISGNDSLASALVGATDFYDMLAKIELISQVAKHDDELIESLTTQLQQYKEAKVQLDIEKAALDTDRNAQEENMQELKRIRDELQSDYEESEDYLERQRAEQASQQRDIESLQADTEAYDAEIEAINAEIARQQLSAMESNNSYYDDDDDYYDDDDDDYSGSYGGGSGDGEISGSYGGGSYSGGFSWPVPGFYGISSGYGYRWGSFHRGIDIAGGGISGAAVTASASGTVILVRTGCTHNYGKDGSCGCNGGYGNYVVVDHGDGVSTTYAHCNDVYVSVGQSVSAGQQLGTVGSTGWSTGMHLHFEITINGSSVDPSAYV